MRSLLLAFGLFGCPTLFAQIKTTKLHSNALSESISYKGTMVDGVTWNDSYGKNIVILSETGEFIGKDQQSDWVDCEGACTDAEIYAYHFIQAADSIKTLWQLKDYQRTCPFDVYAAFSKGSLTITDLNKDNVAEVWFAYKTTCTSDVSPRVMKLFMYEGGKKHGLRGTSKVTPGPEGAIGGEMKLDDAFKGKADSYRQYANRLWNKFVVDKY